MFTHKTTNKRRKQEKIQANKKVNTNIWLWGRMADSPTRDQVNNIFIYEINSQLYCCLLKIYYYYYYTL